ncbi:glutamine-hydrolyzing carbamoyl-phosphate synthase small subunit [Geomicrobium sp. JCM 19039]|uniref:glutamine-hydrolyzing carbamoyl-phosphate synthase small subunit n=1 Tax=Geomicrobium sp. JCM 19039 TaxID=1460636 RepID=UPI00045F3E43|nr:glutamine-hydrolyzing carbamoyl-phosphate synthase small subunit [Geomicrobium sp. JCM 19039]GAK10848.1 carbamoyl-phosphate synthase small chain [Geomicrobium sp. JCM 19039]
MKRQLILEDGHVFTGRAFGSKKEQSGEIVFNTGMTGYQEIMSDPSYSGQIITFTYPLIGNYGTNRSDFETIAPSLHGVVVKSLSPYPNHWKHSESFNELLVRFDVPGIEGVDTRKLTKLIRDKGTVRAVICNEETSVDRVIEQLQSENAAKNQVAKVSTTHSFSVPGSHGPKIVLIDYGAKQNIMRELLKRGCEVHVVPYNTSAKDILKENPDGVMLSNGPGDPRDIPECVDVVKSLVGKTKIFGICLGHQLLCLALGGRAVKMKFGHRGSNHPVVNLRTQTVSLTAQNHGYTIDAESLLHTPLFVTHQAVNDGSVEGVALEDGSAFSVQYHPEAAPGPSDANALFDQFLQQIRKPVKELS